MRFSTRQMCRIALLAAIYFVLKRLAGIEIGTLKLNFATLPVVVSALLFGPLEAALVAAIGEFFYQVLGYGITATTALYVLAPAVRGVVVGCFALAVRGSEKRLERRPALCYAACILAAIITTLFNTAVNALDSIIYGYYTWAYVFGNLLVRLTSGIIIAVIIASIAMPLCIAAAGRKEFAA